MPGEDISNGVRSAIVEALGVDASDVTPEATLMGDLGAESIDILDILFRIERKLGVKIKAADLSGFIQGGIPDEEFADANEIVSAAGLAQLKTVMPQIDADALAGQLEAKDVIKLFSTQNLVNLVTVRVAAVAA